jgi:hypothetical protein
MAALLEREASPLYCLTVSTRAARIDDSAPVLRAEDILALAGTHDGVAAARELLHADPVPADTSPTVGAS